MIPRTLRGTSGLVAGALLLLGSVGFFRVALLPGIGSTLHLRAGLLSLVTVVFGVGRLVADLPAGRLADRGAPLRSFALSGAALAAASAVAAAAHGLTSLLVAAAVMGVASSTTNMTGMAYFSHAPKDVRGKSLATFSAALLGGQSLGPAIAGVVAGAAGWRVAQATGAAVAAGVAAACVVAARHAATRVVADAGQPAAGSQESGDGTQRFLLYLSSFAVFFALGAMPQTLLPVIGADHYGLSLSAVGVVLGIGGLCRSGGAALGGVIADRISRKAALVPALATMGAGAALLELPGGPVVWVAAVVLLSIGSFGSTVAATILADLGTGRGVGRRLGVFRFAGDLGLIAGPLAAGWLYDASGTSAAVAAVTGTLCACAVVTGIGLGETRHADAVPTIG